MQKIISELRRRNVFRVAAAYAVAAWVLLQIADLVLDNINAPDWVMQAFMLALGLGFPLVLVFSWAFEITPEGIKRETDVDRTKSVTHETAKKLDQVTIGLLVLVVVFVFVERQFQPDAGPPAAGVTAAASDKSIAVLAFEDLSQEGDQAYFTDGLSEELLNRLAKIADLQVAGRTSSFAFKGQHRDLREIGEILNVAHVLEGSVRKSGNNIRVTAQLINTRSGFHLFSETYDDELSDIFKVQDAIARQITAALKSQLIGEEAAVEADKTDVRAYQLYLEARQKIHTRDGIELKEASSLLDAALVIDPDYPPALAQKALALALLSDAPGSYGDIPMDVAYAQAAELLDEALRLEPELAEAHAVRGLILPWATRGDEALTHLRRALAINPNLDNAAVWLATLLGNLGRHDEATALLEGVIERDPLFAPAFGNLVLDYANRQRYDRATALIDRYERAAGQTGGVSSARARIALSQRRIADAIRHFRHAFESDSSSTVLRFDYGFALLTIGEYESMPALDMPPFAAVYHLQKGEHEKAVEIVDNIPIRPDDSFVFRTRSYVYAQIGDFDRIAGLVDTHYGGLQAFLERFPRTTEAGLNHLPDLAVTYRELGRQEDFERVLDVIRAAVAAQREQPVHPLNWWYNEASLAALEGDADALLRAYRKIVDANDVDAEPMSSPEFRTYRDDPRFAPIIAALRTRADEERAILGLPPYQPHLYSGP